MNFDLGLAARIGLNLAAILGGVVTLRLGSGLFLPLIFAIFLATILWPSANRLHNFYRLPWPLACSTAVGVLVLINALVVISVLIAVPRLLQSVPNPNNPDAQRQYYDKIRTQVERYSPFPINEDILPVNADDSGLFITVKKTLEGEYVLQALLTALGYVSSYLWEFILILFILLFLLIEGRMLTRRLVEVFGPSRAIQGKVVSALEAMSRTVRDFLVWRTLINLFLGLLLGAFYQFMGLRQAWLWAGVTAVACYIPYIGPLIAGAPPLLDALINTSGWTALGVLVFYTGVIILEGYVIVPLLMGRHMDLNATTVMLACLFWELVWGVPGLFLAMPLMGAIKAICEHVPGWEPWAGLMSAKHVAPLTVAATPPGVADPNRTAVFKPKT